MDQFPGTVTGRREWTFLRLRVRSTTAPKDTLHPEGQCPGRALGITKKAQESQEAHKAAPELNLPASFTAHSRGDPAPHAQDEGQQLQRLGSPSCTRSPSYRELQVQGGPPLGASSLVEGPHVDRSLKHHLTHRRGLNQEHCRGLWGLGHSVGKKTWKIL